MFFTTGRVELKKDNKKIFLEKFDALNSFSDEINYEIRCLEDSEFFFLSSENLSKQMKTLYISILKKILNQKIYGVDSAFHVLL